MVPQKARRVVRLTRRLGIGPRLLFLSAARAAPWRDWAARSMARIATTKPLPCGARRFVPPTWTFCRTRTLRTRALAIWFAMTPSIRAALRSTKTTSWDRCSVSTPSRKRKCLALMTSGQRSSKKKLKPSGRSPRRVRTIGLTLPGTTRSRHWFVLASASISWAVKSSRRLNGFARRRVPSRPQSR